MADHHGIRQTDDHLKQLLDQQWNDHRFEEEFPYELDSELIPEKEERKRKPRTARKEMFKGLPVEEEIIDLPKEQKVCSECGTELELIGQRIVRETLKYVPARLTVVRTIARVYGCPQCKQGEDNANIVSGLCEMFSVNNGLLR